MELEKFGVKNVEVVDWYGFKKYKFDFNGHAAWIAEPEHAAEGKPWAWCMEWPDAFVERIGVLELLKHGFHYVYVNIFDTFASEAGLKVYDEFYDLLQRIDLAEKAALIGLSMGGLYAYRYAARRPENVSAIYGDAPVCNILVFVPHRWQAVKDAYKMTDEELLKFPYNPIDNLAPLIEHNIPVLHVIGLDDEVVRPGLNTDILEKRYLAAGGNIKVLRRFNIGHHPHGHDDTELLYKFLSSLPVKG